MTEDSNATGNAKVQSDRELLLNAQKEGKVLGAYVKLSGPGWLQSAITLGGGSLAGALFLGVLGGTSMLWLQLVAIVFGVIMLSAISYVTLSTGRRPFEAINTEINPALGWGWLVATMLANMIWCMPQFSLCYDALDKNLVPLVISAESPDSDGETADADAAVTAATPVASGLGDSPSTKLTVSILILIATGAIVLMNTRQGKVAKLFDLMLKGLIGMIVICFFGVVALLAYQGKLDFGEIFAGFIPNFDQWSNPAGSLAGSMENLSEEAKSYWSSKVVGSQQTVMIAAAATAVGINMTFLLPYSMLARGWDKPFRGLARFDLSTGMAIPYVLVTSCVVIAAAASFHGKIDEKLMSNDLAVMKQSPEFESVKGELLKRVDSLPGFKGLSAGEKLARAAELPAEEKIMASALVKRNAFQLSKTLEPLLGSTMSNLVFGLGVFGMGFSTIIILMLINGYVFREMFNMPNGSTIFAVGCLLAGISGASWVYVWAGGAKFWLPIITSTFGMMLLPIAYITFFLMMNSKRILGDEKPKGAKMLLWNVLMGLAVAGAVVAAYAAIKGQLVKLGGQDDPQSGLAYWVIVGVLIVYGMLVIIGFIARGKKPSAV